MSRLTTARVVMEFLAFLGYMIVAINTFKKVKGQKAGLLTLQVMLAMSSFLGGLAFDPKTNKDALPIVIRWNLSQPGPVYQFSVYFFQIGWLYYLSMWCFLLSHWQFSYFYLQTSIQLLQHTKCKHQISKMVFNVINAVFCILITVMIIIATIEKNRKCTDKTPSTDQIHYWGIFPQIALWLVLAVFAVALIIFICMRSEKSQVNHQVMTVHLLMLMFLIIAVYYNGQAELELIKMLWPTEIQEEFQAGFDGFPTGYVVDYKRYFWIGIVCEFMYFNLLCYILIMFSKPRVQEEESLTIESDVATRHSASIQEDPQEHKESHENIRTSIPGSNYSEETDEEWVKQQELLRQVDEQKEKRKSAQLEEARKSRHLQGLSQPGLAMSQRVSVRVPYQSTDFIKRSSNRICDQKFDTLQQKLLDTLFSKPKFQRKPMISEESDEESDVVDNRSRESSVHYN